MKTLDLTAAWDNDLSFLATYYPGCPERGESGYSLGEPAEPASFEIKRVEWRGTDLTSFVTDYADYLLDDWAERLMEQLNEE
jgi:hypothetical protein